MYEVHKFGGASIGSLERIKKTIDIINSFSSGSKIIIFSAMGKVTNMLRGYYNKLLQRRNFSNKFEKLKNYHCNMIDNFHMLDGDLFSEIDLLFKELIKTLKNKGDNYQTIL